MEIKFRAKKAGTTEWIYGLPYSVYCGDVDSIVDNNQKIEYIRTDTLGQLWNPSNGLFCYEGDLFEAECSPQQGMKCKKRIVKISRDGKGMTVVIWYNNEWWSYSSMKYTTFKYLGNIWDNSELINGVS